MNKYVAELYNQALTLVLDEFQLSADELFNSNVAECVQGRTSLIVGLHDLGVSDNDIAVCSQKLRRSSVCRIRNHYVAALAPWTVRHCLLHISHLRPQREAVC